MIQNNTKIISPHEDLRHVVRLITNLEFGIVIEESKQKGSNPNHQSAKQ